MIYPSSRKVLAVACMLLLVASCYVNVHGRQRKIRHYAGRIPPGIHIRFFLQVCQTCGEFYGTKYSSACVYDKTFHTFALCYSAVITH